MAGKILLPEYGGNSTVWTTILFFFMTVLFLGYMYAAWLLQKREHLQAKIHTSMLVLGIAALAASSYIAEYSVSSPSLSIMVRLAGLFGIPAFLLAATSTLVQGWYGREKSRSPYRLYAVSNAGSLTGLLAYPFLIEPLVSLNVQQTLWKIVFAGYVGLMGYITLRKWNKHRSVEEVSSRASRPGMTRSLVWFALSALTNGLLIAATAHLTRDIAPVPLLWIAPILLYLVSYIIPFSRRLKVPAGFPYYLALLPVVLFALLPRYALANLAIEAGMGLTLIFAVFLALHTALYAAKPAPASLGWYYTMIALGGCVAGLVCAMGAPYYLPDMWEFPILVGLCILAVGTAAVFYAEKRRHKLTFSLITAGAFLVFLQSQLAIFTVHESVLTRARNFYGVVTIAGSLDITTSGMREMANGKISHGSQEFAIGMRTIPLMYYRRESGLGITILEHSERKAGNPLRIGGIGLGVGTIAAYCKDGDLIRFYEINPVVIDYAEKYFTYIEDCRARGGKVEIAQGDARIVLEKEREEGAVNQFDVLVVDAFSGDAVPFHLMTLDALKLYISHLSDNGIIAYHISNKYIDYLPQLNSQAAAENLFLAQYRSGGSSWVMISAKKLEKPLLYLESIPHTQPQRVWTDNYSNILDALEWSVE